MRKMQDRGSIEQLFSAQARIVGWGLLLLLLPAVICAGLYFVNGHVRPILMMWAAVYALLLFSAPIAAIWTVFSAGVRRLSPDGARVLACVFASGGVVSLAFVASLQLLRGVGADVSDYVMAFTVGGTIAGLMPMMPTSVKVRTAPAVATVTKQASPPRPPRPDGIEYVCAGLVRASTPEGIDISLIHVIEGGKSFWFDFIGKKTFDVMGGITWSLVAPKNLSDLCTPSSDGRVCRCAEIIRRVQQVQRDRADTFAERGAPMDLSQHHCRRDVGT